MKITPAQRSILIVTALVAITVAGVVIAHGDPRTTTAALSTATGEAAVGLTTRLDREAVLLGQEGQVRMEVVLTGRDSLKRGHRTATDLVVVLDESGSMGGHKIQTARAAIDELIDGLGDGDRFALVRYASQANIRIPLSEASVSSRSHWKRIIRGIGVGGGTNLSSGLDLAATLADESRGSGRAARVILISDGEANEGDSTPEGLRRRASRAVSGEWILSTIGVGENFNEFLMAQLADAGTGNYYDLMEVEKLAGVLDAELGASQETVASRLEVAIDPAPGVRVVAAAGYPLEVRGDETVFRPGALFAGQERRIWVTLEVPNARVGEHSPGTVRADWREGRRPFSSTVAALPHVAVVATREKFVAAIDADAWAVSVVQEDWGQLRQEVAKMVDQGQKDEALEAISAYNDSNASLNSDVQSDAVARNYVDAQALAREVESAFTGQDQSRKRNVVSKSNQSAGWTARRVGSKKVD